MTLGRVLLYGVLLAFAVATCWIGAPKRLETRVDYADAAALVVYAALWLLALGLLWQRWAGA